MLLISNINTIIICDYNGLNENEIEMKNWKQTIIMMIIISSIENCEVNSEIRTENKQT